MLESKSHSKACFLIADKQGIHRKSFQRSEHMKHNNTFMIEQLTKLIRQCLGTVSMNADLQLILLMLILPVGEIL